MLATAPGTVYGHASPRIAPPRPLRSNLAPFLQAASDLAITLMPWQEVAATYMTAVNADDRWLYPDFATIVSRQQGKTELLLPFIVSRMRMGRRIMHTSQNRELPREVHGRVAEFFERRENKHELAKKPRFANGQEEIRLVGGGSYRIVAPSRSGARGHPNDDLIIDEVRELDDFAFIAAAKPTLMASPNPQTVYLSNAGDDTSVVLNALRARAADDPSLAYLEWSAPPDVDASDRAGWPYANPAIGHLPGALDNLENNYRSYSLAGQMAIFETEHLCRWVPTMRPRLVDEFGWMRCRAASVGEPRRAAAAISMDPGGSRASVVMAWRQDDKTIAIKELFDVAVNEGGLDELGDDAMKMIRSLGISVVGFDKATDLDFSRHFKTKAKSIIGKDFDNATEAFVRAIAANQIRWVDGDHITTDLVSTSRKDNDETGTFHAVKAQEDVPITAALAAIRAFWLASGPALAGEARIW